MVEDPEQFVVFLGTEDFGDKSSAFDKKLGGQLHGLKGQFGLVEGILDPSGTDVGGAIVENSVGFPGLQVSSYRGTTFLYFGGAKLSQYNRINWTNRANGIFLFRLDNPGKKGRTGSDIGLKGDDARDRLDGG